MVPDGDEFRLGAAPPQAQAQPQSGVAAVGAIEEHYARASAWLHYSYFRKILELHGESYDRQRLLEAAFRGNNLVYGAAPDRRIA